MKENTSSTGRVRKLLMSVVAKILKDNQLSSGVSTMETTRNGKFSILIKIRDHKRRDLTKKLDSTATDHSTWYQDFHYTELPNLTELTILLSTDTSREEITNNGLSTVPIRPSDPTTGRTMLGKSNLMVDHKI